MSISIIAGPRARGLGSENSNVIDTDEALDLKEAPESLVIIGADYIGVEMAQIFSSFGSKVTVVERKDSAIEVIDSEVSSILIKSLEKSGIKFIFGKEITEISGEKVLAGSEEVASAKVILLTTREADLTALKDVKLEVSNGNVVANDKMQSSLKNVYVPGDINGKNLLAHAAFKMGDIDRIKDLWKN